MSDAIDNKVTATHFTFVESKGLWYLKLRHNDIDIYVAGAPDSPDSNRIQLAKLVLENLQELTQSAVKYLLAFVDQRKLENDTSWAVTVIECGKHITDPVNEVTLGMILESDLYGEWQVSFRHFIEGQVNFYPIALGRRQI